MGLAEAGDSMEMVNFSPDTAVNGFTRFHALIVWIEVKKKRGKEREVQERSEEEKWGSRREEEQNRRRKEKKKERKEKKGRMYTNDIECRKLWALWEVCEKATTSDSKTKCSKAKSTKR